MIPTSLAEIPGIVDAVRAGQCSGLLRDVSYRRTQLEQLRRLLLENEEVLAAAAAADLGRAGIETFTSEIGFVVSEIDHALAHLDEWTRPTKARVQLSLKPAHAVIVPEPLGTVLIIAAWNYPIQLNFAPLVGVLAAGNAAILKPSEVGRQSSAAIAELTPRYLDERIVRVVTGGVEHAEALLERRFDHIFFTGAAGVGRAVMQAAARHLTPVTLELGGKNPVIVAADADIEIAARRIAWGRFLNAGQTCVAPDYVLVEEAVEDQLLGALLRAVHDFFGDDPRLSGDFGRIIDDRHFSRLEALLDAGGYDATVTGGDRDRGGRYIAPTVLCGVKPDAPVMHEEIFGPILPVVAVDDIGQAIEHVAQHERPLALYLFTRSDATVERVVAHTSSGAVSVNHVVVQIAVPDLPFGGVGASGMGAYHGVTGFRTFSHMKPVLTKPPRPDPPVLYPPYKSWKARVLRRMR